MTRIPERLPAPLSERLSLASQAIYSRLGREVDVAVGGIPFMLATSSEVPQSIETIAVRKDQLDSEKDPGEQSLSGWWRRSQSSFHQGAGFLYEPTTDDPHEGFWDSENVEVFNKGDLTLLPAVVSRGDVSVQWNRLRSYRASGTRTNYCTNPSFETNTTGWTASTGVSAITRVAGSSGSGSWVLQLTANGTTASLVEAPISTLTTGATASMSIRVWVPSGAPPLKIVSNFAAGPISAATGAWTTISLTAPFTFGPQLQIQSDTPATAGTNYLVDACLIEEGAVVGSYFDGNSVDGAWTGTTNNSVSTLTIGNGERKWSGCATVLGRFYWDNAAANHAPAGKTIADGLVSGANFYDVATDGTLYQGLLSSPGTATSWPCGAAASRLGWGKHRLWVIGGRRLWQPNLSLASGSAQSPVFTHPNQGWTYTCMAEGPAAMFFGGHDGQSSTIQAVTLDTGGGLPTLSGAAISAALPDGELVQELAVVAGQFIGIGTTAGFRVGLMDGSAITYGPLIIEPDGVRGTTALVSEGRFFLVAFETGDGLSQVYKVDTSVEISTGVYAYAKDMRCSSASVVGDDANKGTIVSLAVLDSGLTAATSPGRWEEVAGQLCRSGWIQTSRIRYRTTEPKSFKYLSMDLEPVVGTISVDAILEGGSTLPLGTINQQGQVFQESLGIESEPMRYLSLRFNFARQTASTGPTMHSYLLRATPAAAPQRLITLPLLCYDSEQAKSGQRYGKDGYANDRLIALQQLEDEARTLVYQDFTTGTDTGINVSIESMKFVQMTPRNSDTGNMGGILYLQLRTVDS